MTIAGILLALFMIAGLHYLTREQGATSFALWIPSLWFAIVGSRPLTAWLNVHREVTAVSQYTDSSPVDAAFFGVLIAASALVLNRRWKYVRRAAQLNLPILIYFVYCAASISWTDDPVIAIKRWVKALGEFLVILVLLSDRDPMLACKRMFSRVSLVLIPLSIVFIYFIPSMGSSYDPTDNKTIYFGVCTWKNQLGVLCLVCGLTSLWQLFDAFRIPDRNARWRRVGAHGFLCLASAWLIVKADAMTSFSCLALASLVLFLMMRMKLAQRPAATLPLVCGATGLALFALFGAPVMLESLGRNSTLTGRTQIWSAVLAQHTNPLIGTGFESFWMGDRLLSVWSLSQYGIEESHNGYLEMYVNLGWMGVAILALLIVTGYSHAAALFRRSPSEGSLRIALFTAALIFNFTEAGFRMQTLIWLGFLLSITNVPPELFGSPRPGSAAGNKGWFAGSEVKVLQ